MPERRANASAKSARPRLEYSSPEPMSRGSRSCSVGGRGHLVRHLPISIEELDDRISIGTDPEHQAVPALGVLECDPHRAVSVLSEHQPWSSDLPLSLAPIR